MRCVDACLSGAREIVGLALSIDDIVREAVADRMFYKNSGGGVTISGGEPLFFPEFTLELSGRLKREEGVHLAIETSCFASWEKTEPLLRFIDLFIVDIKSLDSEKHKKVIGWSLETILKNIENLFQAGARVRIHLPIIPGFNDSLADYDAYNRYLARFSDKIDGVDILPYHCYGAGKYAYLGLGDSYQYKGVEDLKGKDVMPLAARLKEAGIASITVGGLVGMGKDRGTSAGDAGVREQAAG
jgi:pyruvate formate lyase activating enzyme